MAMILAELLGAGPVGARRPGEHGGRVSARPDSGHGPTMATERVAGRVAGRAGWLAAAILALLLAARMADIPLDGTARQSAFTAGLFVLPLLAAVPGTRFLLERYTWPVLAVQAVLTWVPFAVFGQTWIVGVGGLLAGMVLLAVRSPLSWVLAGGLLVTEVVVRAALTGLPPSTSAPIGVFWVVTYYVDDCLIFFGTVRLAQIVSDVERARRSAAGVAVAGERWQAAQSLQATIGERLADVAGLAAAAQRCLARDAARARVHVAAAGVTARDASARARALVTGRRALPEEQDVRPPTALVSTRVAWGVLVTVLLGYTTENLAYVATTHYPPGLTAFACGSIVAGGALQLHHSWAVRQGRAPRWWPWTLAVQALLVYAIVLPFVHAYIGGLAGFMAGSGLLLIPGRRRWAWFAAVVGTWPVLEVTLSLRGYVVPARERVPSLILNLAVVTVVGLFVYALTELSGAAVQMEDLRAELSRLAVTQERMRIARDVHDLLGLGLYAIALKSDLAVRLIGHDDARAATEIAELGRICGAARADIREVTDDDRRLSIAAELAAAAPILSSAGVEVDADLADRLPPAADTVLAPVLREAVTNVLRHSTATSCRIRLVTTDDALRLRVSNDGAGNRASPATGRRSGRGLANLSARVQAAGGRLDCGHTGDRFDLVAEIPLPEADRAASAGALDPAC